MYDSDIISQTYAENLTFMLQSAAVCTLLYSSGYNLFAPFQCYQKLEEGQKKEWNARFVALLHSVAAIFLTTKAIIQFPYEGEFEHYCIYEFTPELCMAAAVSCGYFLWDFGITWYNWKSEGTDYFQYQGLIHGGVCFLVYAAALRPMGLFFTSLHLLFEYSTPFLHIRWYLIKLGYGGSPIGALNDYMFVLAFFLARVVLGPFLAYFYFQLLMAEFWNAHHFVYFPSTIICNTLNYYWFYLILQSALVASPQEKKEISKKKYKKSSVRTHHSRSPAPRYKKNSP